MSLTKTRLTLRVTMGEALTPEVQLRYELTDKTDTSLGKRGTLPVTLDAATLAALDGIADRALRVAGVLT